MNNLSSYPELKHSYFLNASHALNRLSDEQLSSGNFIHQRYLNLLNDIYFVDFSGFIKIKSRHQLGVLASGFKEGPYISKTSAGLHYAYTIRAFNNSSFSVGIKAGLNSIQYQGSLSGVNGQSTAPDLSADLLYRHKKYFLFYAYKQMLSSALQPFNTPIPVKSFHEFRIGLNLELGRKLILVPQSHILIYKDRQDLYGGSLSLSVHSLISLGIATYNFKSAIWQVTVFVPDVNYWRISLAGSYRQMIGTKQLSLYNNSWELGLTFSKKIRERVHELEE